MADEEKELEVYGPAGTKFRVRGYDLMTVLVCCGLIFFGYIFFTTMNDIKISLTKLAESQREMSCIIALPPEDRLKQLNSPESFCKRISRWET